MGHYIDYFKTGDVHAFCKAQATWVTDISPRIEHIIGFIESYRDPSGLRCEWQSMVSISDPEETSKLEGLVQNAAKFIRLLLWAAPGGENGGLGPFESSTFTAPNITVVHALAFCSSTVRDGCNLPNIREDHGGKNIVFSNRLVIKADANPLSTFVHPSEAQTLKDHGGIVYSIKNAIHELLGHGSGRMLRESRPGVFNFDKDKPPTNPLTGKPIQTWYKGADTWITVFEDLANTMEECRATVVSYYLPDEKEILELFGFHDSDALEGAETPAANRDFAIFKYLLLHGEGVFKVDYDASANTVQVSVDRSKTVSHGKPALGQLALRLHVWRSIADVESLKAFYVSLTAVDGEHEAWRQAVMSAGGEDDLVSSTAVRTDAGGKIVQANTFLKDDSEVELRIYEATNEGLIRSFVEREV
ncbi:peptidase family M49-domain-containing protein [Bombardia bombarda]|uniref:Peptidase family M49-domain-containing protein n=1 Tax=Bombardia bombarda TaxID=252184 RepID=A0AA39U323_9PEZI|nr:peptidase family M49-domain-containing protein [Bombardia bombarda]